MNYNFSFFSYKSNFFKFFMNILKIKKKITHLFRNSYVYEVINIISTLDYFYNECSLKYFYLNMNIWNSINTKKKIKKIYCFFFDKLFWQRRI